MRAASVCGRYSTRWGDVTVQREIGTPAGYRVIFSSGAAFAGTLHGSLLTVRGFASAGTVLGTGDVVFADGGRWTCWALQAALHGKICTRVAASVRLNV